MTNQKDIELIRHLTWTEKDIKELEKKIEELKSKKITKLEMEFRDLLYIISDDILKAIDGLLEAKRIYDKISGFFRKQVWSSCHPINLFDLIECANNKQILVRLHRQLPRHLNDAIFIILMEYATDTLYTALELLGEYEKEFIYLTVNEKDILLNVREQYGKRRWWTYRINSAYRHVFNAYIVVNVLYELTKKNKWFSKLHMPILNAKDYLEEALRLDFYQLYRYSRALEDIEEDKEKSKNDNE